MVYTSSENSGVSPAGVVAGKGIVGDGVGFSVGNGVGIVVGDGVSGSAVCRIIGYEREPAERAHDSCTNQGLRLVDEVLQVQTWFVLSLTAISSQPHLEGVAIVTEFNEHRRLGRPQRTSNSEDNNKMELASQVDTNPMQYELYIHRRFSPAKGCRLAPKACTTSDVNRFSCKAL